MTIIICRLRPGLAGERARVAHLFDLPQSGELQARCGKVFPPVDLELLDIIRGMPCEACLINTPRPVRGYAPAGTSHLPDETRE
jgi:hypothetical protein